MSSNRTYLVFRWIVKILAAALTVFGLLFYFGYGNPLPFVNPAYTLWDNMWMCVFPVMFAGLITGLFFERTGGWIVVVSVGAGLIGGLAVAGEFVWYMLAPFALGILYLIAGHFRAKYRKSA
jgi:hypothetical protein